MDTVVRWHFAGKGKSTHRLVQADLACLLGIVVLNPDRTIPSSKDSGALSHNPVTDCDCGRMLADCGKETRNATTPVLALAHLLPLSEIGPEIRQNFLRHQGHGAAAWNFIDEGEPKVGDEDADTKHGVLGGEKARFPRVVGILYHDAHIAQADRVCQVLPCGLWERYGRVEGIRRRAR